jgi:L-ascorbate metabolism protein UlaG (beta-lactamase superfamily)
MGPLRAAQAVEMIRPKQAIPMHFGAFPALTGTPEEFKKALRRYGLEFLMRQMKVGGDPPLEVSRFVLCFTGARYRCSGSFL